MMGHLNGNAAIHRKVLTFRAERRIIVSSMGRSWFPLLDLKGALAQTFDSLNPLENYHGCI